MTPLYDHGVRARACARIKIHVFAASSPRAKTPHSEIERERERERDARDSREVGFGKLPLEARVPRALLGPERRRRGEGRSGLPREGPRVAAPSPPRPARVWVRGGVEKEEEAVGDAQDVAELAVPKGP